MRGAPWEGLYYGFVLELVVGFAAFVYALGSEDFLARTLGWVLFALMVVLAVRTLRRAVRLGDDPDRPVGRSWFGG